MFLLMFAVLSHDCSMIKEKQFLVQQRVNKCDPSSYQQKFISKNKCTFLIIDDEYCTSIKRIKD